MKTSPLIDYEKLTASGISPAVFDQRPFSILIPHNILSLESGIFSRDGPLPGCKG